MTDPSAIDLETIVKKAPGLSHVELIIVTSQLVAAVEALRNDLADLEALRAEDHAAIRQTILEKEAVEARAMDLAGALENCVSLVKLKVGSIDLTGDAAIKQACTALAAMPAQAMERVRARKDLQTAATFLWGLLDVYNRAGLGNVELEIATHKLFEALTKLGALGKEEG